MAYFPVAQVGVAVCPDQRSDRNEEASVDLGMDVSAAVVDFAETRLESPARTGRMENFIFAGVRFWCCFLCFDKLFLISAQVFQ